LYLYLCVSVCVLGVNMLFAGVSESVRDCLIWRLAGG
jgi:hypothetical protein